MWMIGLKMSAAIIVSALWAGAALADVSDADLAQPAGGDWLHFNGGWSGARISTLTPNRIDTGNVGDLGVEWTYSIGGDTWPGDSREYGGAGPWGAGPWIVGSYDAELGMYFTGTANAYPWNPYTERAGVGGMANEGAAAIVTVNVDSGEVVWRYTAVPGDPWDYGVPQTPTMLATTIDDMRVLVQPNKTGFTHYLAAATGEFLRADQWGDICIKCPKCCPK